ncbi:MAG: hypothetical protein JSR77_16100 [Planctomycetes bacterium]|nr:hypothetical protein [Planctomycetota bacterium]
MNSAPQPARPSNPRGAGGRPDGTVRPLKARVGLRPSVAVNPGNIPAGLRGRDRWVLWALVHGTPAERAKSGYKPKKNPCGPIGSSAINAMDPSNWMSFEKAAAAYSQNPAAAGLGFVCVKGEGITGLDLDGCVGPDGTIHPAAKEILSRFPTYTELSPSGTGIRVFMRATKAAVSRCKKAGMPWGGEIEVYDRCRLLTVTGRPLGEYPVDVVDCQSALDELIQSLWPPRASKAASTPSPVGGPEALTDELLIHKAGSASNGAAFSALWSGDTSAYHGDDSAADLALCNHLAFWTGRDAARMDRLFRRSGLFREKWDEQRGARTYGQMTIALAIEGCTDVYTGAVREAVAEGDSRPQIVLGMEESASADEVIAALGAEPELFKRGHKLVRPLYAADDDRHVKRGHDAVVIGQVPLPTLREFISRNVILLEPNGQGGYKPARPKRWLVAAIDARGEWKAIRPLEAVATVPFLRPDGTVCCKAGYDHATGVLYKPSGAFPDIKERPSLEDIKAAVETLFDIVGDFHFHGEWGRAAWLASLLTPLARHAFRGPAPLFLIDANVRGAGKSLLAKVTGIIAQGHECAASGYAHEPAEMRKLITSIALAGDAIVLLDNVQGPFGNASLDRALTTEMWNDRLLGKNEQATVRLNTTWYATGNNIAVVGDTARRIVHIRLNVPEERPEERCDFKYPNLLETVRANWRNLARAGLTILRGFCEKGRPRANLKPFGGFEPWSDLVRGAVEWATKTDPCDRSLLCDAGGDGELEAVLALMNAWESYCEDGCGVITDLIDSLFGEGGGSGGSGGDAAAAMRAAIRDFTGVGANETPNPRQFGARLRDIRERVVDGKRFTIHPTRKSRNGLVWQLASVLG